MMGGTYTGFGLSCALFVFAVLWTPAFTNDHCYKCNGTSGDPSFLSNHKYNYAVEGVVGIYLTGAEKQETGVKLSGQVSVAAVGGCGHVLRVLSLQITGPDGKKYDKPPGIDKPVQFSMLSGRLHSEICTESGDTRRSLNIKRAIISLLQNPNKHTTETDVFGVCPTERSEEEEGGVVLLHRTRDLSRCGYREQGRNDLIAGVLDSHAEIKDTQVLQSTLFIESKVKNGVPEKVSATEEYLYKPFSVGQNGARAKVHTKLTLTGQSGGSDTGKFTEVHSIIFENPHGLKSEQSQLQNAVQALKDTSRTLQREASSKSAGEFAQFVRILRLTTKDELLKLYSQAKGNNLEKRIYLDALLRAGTAASIEASIQLLKNNDLSPLEQKLVFLSLGNAKHVTDDALKAAAGLLDLPNIPKEVYLGVGALAGTYCRSHQCHGRGSQSTGISALSQKLAGKLHNCKPKNKVEEDYIVAALKGIRSIRHIEDSLIDRLAQCVTDKSVKARVKVAALEAFHADPCTAKLKKVAIDTMNNRQLDSELRIKAYLAVIDCPCAESATQIKNLLDSETVRQVGRFIATSLHHIRASANPDKQLAREHYGRIGVPNKFGVDDRKYSFYREASFDVDALGIGGTVEQSVIYSQDSFLPRSATLNLTAELFGHNLNILEVGGRQGNLDRVVEHLLGPKGFFNTHSPQDIYDSILDKAGKVESKMRQKRSLKIDIDNFDKQVKDESVPYNNELDLDLYVKLFGTDAVFLSLGDDKGFSLDAVINDITKLLAKGVNEAKNFKQEVRAHLLFLDAELAYPTSTGFPLKLDLVGSATGRLEASTNIDLEQIFRDPANAKVEIKLVPSTDIEISGSFTVDADAVATGLKVVTNLHSSTGGHFIAKVLENGQGFDVQFGLPVEKQEIITASNDLVFVTREKGHKDKEVALKIDTDKKEYAGCFDQLAGVVGLTLCGELSIPFSVSGQDAQSSIQKFVARYPLTGPAKVKLHLEKAGDFSGYHVKYLYRRKENSRREFELLFELQGGKKVVTSVTGELIENDSEYTVRLGLDSPIKKTQGQLTIKREPNEYHVLAKASWDQDEYYGKIGFTMKHSQNRVVYHPFAEYQFPSDEKKSLKINGEVVREISGSSTKYSLNGVKVNMPNSNEVVDINGFYVEDIKSLLEVKAKLGEHSAVIKGAMTKQDGNLEFTNTLNPNVNFKLNGKFVNEYGRNHYQNDLEITYGPDLQSETMRVIFNQLFKYDRRPDSNFDLLTRNTFALNGYPVVLKAYAEVNPKKVDIELNGNILGDTLDIKATGRTHIKKAGDYNVKVEAKTRQNGVEVFAKRDIVDEDKSNFENYISIKDVGKYELSGVVTHKTKANDVNVGANGHLRFRMGKQQQQIKFDFGLQDNTNTHSSHLKLNTEKELVNYLLKLQRGDNASGELKLVLLDELAATGQFKVTDSDGKGNGGFLVHFKRADRKFKGDVKFVAKEPVFNADVDLFLNFGKDNNDKVHFSTNNKLTEKLIDSKNQLVYNGQKTEVNVKGEGQLDAKSHAYAELVLPTERVISLKFDRDAQDSGEGIKINADVELADAPKRNAPGSKISYNGKFDSNIEKDILNYEAQFGIYLKDNRNWVHTFLFKNNPVSGNVYKSEMKHEITGTLMPAPYSAHGLVEFQGESGNKAKYFFKVNYGDKFTFNWDGKYHKDFYSAGDNKLEEDFTVALRLPLENPLDLKLDFNILVLLPENKDTLLDYTVGTAVHIRGEQYKVEAAGKLAEGDGSTKVKVLIPHQEPFTLDTSYKSHQDEERRTGEIEIKTNYGKGKSATVVATGVVDPSSHEYELEVKASAPQADGPKKLQLSIHSKNPAVDTYFLSGKLDIDGQKSEGDASLTYSKTKPQFTANYNLAGQQPTRIAYTMDIITEDHVKMYIKLVNLRGIDLKGDYESVIEKDSLTITTDVTCPQLNLNKAKLKISSNGKRLEFNAENDNKNVYSGSTSYISKQEGSKTIVEGTGSVKMQNQQKSASFKYIRTVLSGNLEQGVETFINIGIGDASNVVEFRATNLEYKTSFVLCEEKKQCAHAEFNSKINSQGKGYQHLLNVVMDLRTLGFKPEFGLQLKNELTEQYQLVSSLNVHLNKEDKKYHFNAYNRPRPGGHIGYESGVKLELPKRTLAAEAVLSAGSNNLPFPLSAEVVLYLDKNKPQQKLGAKAYADLTGDDKAHNFKAELKFHHPKIPQDTGVTVQSSMRHEAINNFLFDTTVSITQEGQSKVFLEVKPNHVKVLVHTPLVKLIDAEGSVSESPNDKKIEGDFKFSLLEGKPVQMRALAKEYNYFEFTTGYSEDTQRKLSVVAHVEVDKRVELSADIVLPGAKKNIARVALFLQDSLLKTDYGASKDNFNYFIKALRSDLDKLQGRMSQLSEKAQADAKQRLQRYKTNLKRVEEDYRQELEKLKHEVINDQTLQDLDKALQGVVQFVARIAYDIAAVTTKLADTINKIVVETWEKLDQIYTKELKPQVDKVYENVSEVVVEYANTLLDLVAHFAAIVADFAEKHKPELKELTDAITNIFKSLTRLLVERLREFRVVSSEAANNFLQQLKEIPMVVMLKEKISELAVPERVVEMVNDVHLWLKPLLPNKETVELVETIVRYVQKKIRNEKVDEQRELRNIVEKANAVVLPYIQFIKNQIGQYGFSSVFNWNTVPSFSGAGQGWSTAFGGAASFSLLNQLVSGQVPDPIEYIRAYRPRSLNPLDEVPAKLRGVVVNGQHIFTFDGSHLTFPGSCRYVLVHDYVDRNFTLLIELKNGQPKSLALEDKSGAIIELKENGQVVLNNANHGFPVEEKDVVAFRKANGRLALKSQYGLYVECSPKLTVCYVEVSGFYLGKLRGLLGDGNNEPYDDFRLPNGKIVTSQAEFGHAYRATGSCASPKVPQHSHHQLHAALPAECERVFGPSSPLWPLSPLLDAAPFRQACIHAVGADPAHGRQQACDIARGYTALAVTGLLPAVLPPHCLHCSDAGKDRALFTEYELTLPAKQADLVLLVETTQTNEKTFKALVLPVVSQLVDSLKQKHIDDIKVHLVGLTSRIPYPILYDTENVKLKGAKIKFEDESRYNYYFKTVHLDHGMVDKYEDFFVDKLNDFIINLGASNIQRAYTSALQLPLRAGAIKAVISVASQPCQKNFLAVELARMLVVGTVMEMNAVTHSIITVTPGLELPGKPPIIGYDSSSVILVGDKKKGRDTQPLRAQLHPVPDACVDFVEATDGVIFSANNFNVLNGGQQKQFIQTTAAVLAERMTSHQLQQECSCQYVDAFTARSVCFKKSEKDTSRRRK